MGDRILNFVKTVFFVDKSNQLMAELTFNKNVKNKILRVHILFIRNKVELIKLHQQSPNFSEKTIRNQSSLILFRS